MTRATASFEKLTMGPQNVSDERSHIALLWVLQLSATVANVVMNRTDIS